MLCSDSIAIGLLEFIIEDFCVILPLLVYYSHIILTVWLVLLVKRAIVPKHAYSQVYNYKQTKFVTNEVKLWLYPILGGEYNYSVH